MESLKDEIRAMLEEALPIVNLDSDFLYEELDSLGVTTIMMLLSDRYGIHLDIADATPRNLRSIESLARMVESKMAR